MESKNGFNQDEFKVKFRAFFALFAFCAGMGFLFLVVLNQRASESRFTEYIVGFLTGSLLSLILAYYFGNSELAEKATPVKPIEPEPELPLPNPVIRPDSLVNVELVPEARPVLFDDKDDKARKEEPKKGEEDEKVGLILD